MSKEELKNGVPLGGRRGLRAGPGPGPDGRCAARSASPGHDPVLGPSSSIEEMASHLHAGETTMETEDDRGAPESAPRRSDQIIHECRHGPERPERPPTARTTGTGSGALGASPWPASRAAKRAGRTRKRAPSFRSSNSRL